MSGAHFTICEAAAAAGCTPGELRTWSDRYGWPRPHRAANGYRIFTRTTVDILRRVVRHRDGGVPIGEIIGTGEPVLPNVETHRPRPDLARVEIPAPRTENGQALVRILMDAAARQPPAASLRSLAETHLPRVHPSDRTTIKAAADRLVAALERADAP